MNTYRVKNRYLNQITKFHVMTVLLLSQNYDIRVIETFTKQAFSFIMHRFFNQYLNSQNAKSVMKTWFFFQDQKTKFHHTCECWSYQSNSNLFWNFCKSLSFELSCLTRKVMMFLTNSILTKRNWFIMNFIMNKTRNFLHSINVNKLMFIYINKRTFDRVKNTKIKLKFADLNIEKTNLCDIKNKLLQKEISLTLMIIKQSTSQIIMSDATRSWLNTWKYIK